MCLFEALYLCITGGGSKERLGKVCNILQWSFLQHSSARSEKKVGTGESNNLEEHCKSVKVCMRGILQFEFKMQNNWSVKSVKQSV